MDGRRVRQLGAGVLLMLALAGCSVFDASDNGDAGDGGAPSASPSAAAATPVASLSPGATVAPLPVVGTRRTADGEIPVEVGLNTVQAGDTVMTVTWTAKNALPVSTSGTGKKWQVAGFFTDGVYQKLTDGQSELGNVADGVYVIDAKNAKRYPVARDAEGRCVCSGDLSGTFVSPGESTVFSAVFKAPPADVTEVDVAVPHAGVFAKVPVSR